ncbi:MAG: hypothetical protein JSU85_06035 [Candidatus Zixiibacteriota bacterium]|nr:MAG: hypothetical protein JSU85_06035 [candidate division Zixibacteria bacterium]
MLPENELVFHPLRSEDRSAHPLLGLDKFGPLSRAMVNSVLDPIRICAIFPFGYKSHLISLFRELEGTHKPIERPQYLPIFRGFSNIFGIRLVLASDTAHVELPNYLDEKITSSDNPHVLLAETLGQSINQVNARRLDFDILVILLAEKWEKCFIGLEGDEFDLHDHLKAITAVQNIPMQILREDRVFQYKCRCSVMWRLSLALYCKAGGIPWKLTDSSPETAYIGISYAIRRYARPRFITCCSQVFDADGTGLEFILYESDNIQIDGDNPFLNRSDMRRLMARSLGIYQSRHGGRTPKRVIIHKSTEFKKEEIEGCFDAWKTPAGLDLIQIQVSTPWRGIYYSAPKFGIGKKGSLQRYPCPRGTFLQLGTREMLLWTQGNVKSILREGNFYKEGKGIPSPLLIKRFGGHSSWDNICMEILGLTKMNWNNDSLYDRLPVTLGYAKILARVVKRMPKLTRKPYNFKFFM